MFDLDPIEADVGHVNDWMVLIIWFIPIISILSCPLYFYVTMKTDRLQRCLCRKLSSVNSILVVSLAELLACQYAHIHSEISSDENVTDADRCLLKSDELAQVEYSPFRFSFQEFIASGNKV
jgi:hypothetical protein